MISGVSVQVVQLGPVGAGMRGGRTEGLRDSVIRSSSLGVRASEIEIERRCARTVGQPYSTCKLDTRQHVWSCHSKKSNMDGADRVYTQVTVAEGHIVCREELQLRVDDLVDTEVGIVRVLDRCELHDGTVGASAAEFGRGVGGIEPSSVTVLIDQNPPQDD